MKYTTGNTLNNRVKVKRLLDYCLKNKIVIKNYEFIDGDINSPKLDLKDITEKQLKEIEQLWKKKLNGNLELDVY